GLSLVQERIARLGPSDLDRQIWLIRASLADGSQPQAGSGRPIISARTGRRQTGAEAAQDIARIAADRISELAIVENDRASWLVLREIRTGTMTAAPAGLDLYSGLPGIAMFLATAGRHFGEARYLALAEAALRESLSLLADDRSNTLGTGAF